MPNVKGHPAAETAGIQKEGGRGLDVPPCSGLSSLGAAMQELWGKDVLDDSGDYRVETPVFNLKENADHWREVMLEGGELQYQRTRGLVLHESEVDPTDRNILRRFVPWPDEERIAAHLEAYRQSGKTLPEYLQSETSKLLRNVR